MLPGTPRCFPSRLTDHHCALLHSGESVCYDSTAAVTSPSMKQHKTRPGKLSTPADCKDGEWMLQKVGYQPAYAVTWPALLKSLFAAVALPLNSSRSCAPAVLPLAMHLLLHILHLEEAAHFCMQPCPTITLVACQFTPFSRPMPSKASWRSSGAAHSSPAAKQLGWWPGSSWLPRGKQMLLARERISTAHVDRCLHAAQRH